MPRAGRLALKMLQGKDDVVAHFDFLHKKTPHSLQAYDALDSLKKKFSGLPPIDPLFAERFNEHLVKFKRKYIKQTILWITTTYKLEKAFAKRLVAVCLPLVKIKS